MISEYKDTFYIKATLLTIMVLLFILPTLTLKAVNFGGNDSILSPTHSNTLVTDKKISIKEMTAEQLTAFIDEAFDMDSIPFNMINEINMAVAILEQKENDFENVVIMPPSNNNKSTETNETSSLTTINEPKLIKPQLDKLFSNQVYYTTDNLSPIPKPELKAKEQLNESYQVDLLAKKTVVLITEKFNTIPTNIELKPTEKVIGFVQIDKLDIKQTNLAINDDNILPTDIQLKQTEKMEVRFIVDKLEINRNAIALENKPKLITEINLLQIETLSNITENISNEVSSNTESVTISEENNNSILISTLNTPSNDPTIIHPIDLQTFTENNTNKLPDTSGIFSIPSADHYVSWEINKLFPEKDMLKMKKDTSITLILIDNAHKYYYHPFNGPITSQFGWRDSAQHNGIDIDLNRGDKVSAAFDGMVRVARRYGSFGNVVIIRHYNGLETIYAHLSKIKVKPGQLISSGDLVGLGGSTGHSTGTHLHFEVRFKGVPINPKYFISLSEQKLMCEEFTLKKTKWGLAAFPKNTKLYIVEKGDTVFEIAKRFGTTTTSIKELNHLSGSRVRLKAGQQINVVR
jgi:murein DD-endopeptidase MepM/ murein hydrolase activator NlpD